MSIKEYWKIFSKGLFDENPILRLALSLCPAVAVTGSVATALTMGLVVAFVISVNNIAVSISRNLVNPKVRVPVYLTSIATIVTVSQLILEAFFPTLYKSLGIYLALVVVFAIILARAEVYASKNPIFPSFLDGLGMGVGFTLAMVVIGTIREILGNGTILGFSVFGESYSPALIMILPPGGFITIGLLVGAIKLYDDVKAKRRKKGRVA